MAHRVVRERVRAWRLGRWELRRVWVQRGERVENPQWELAVWRRFPDAELEEDAQPDRCAVALRWYGWPAKPWEVEGGERVVRAAESMRRERVFPQDVGRVQTVVLRTELEAREALALQILREAGPPDGNCN